MQAETAPPPREGRGLRARIRRLKDRIAALSRTRHAHAAMLGIAVVDGSVFPIPPFALLVPMVMAEPRKWARYATTGTLASLFGGLIGYGLGYLMMMGLAGLSISTEAPIVSPALGIDTTLREALTQNFWMLALLCSILPTPYKVVAIGSGLVGVGLPAFLLASIIGRSARFFGVSGAFALFGEGARRYIKV